MPTLLSILWVLPLFVAGYGVGRRLLGRLAPAARPLSVEITLSLALGWVALGLVLVVLGLAGALYRPVLWGLLLASVLVGAGPAWGLLGAARERWGAWRRHVGAGQRALLAALGLLALITLVRSCTYCLLQDTWVYHYDLALRYLQHHRFLNTWGSQYDLGPHAFHLLLSWAMGLGGELAANKLCWLMTWGMLLGTYAAARACGWTQESGLYAAAILGGVFVVAGEAAGGLVDTTAALGTVAAGTAALTGLETGRKRDLVVGGLCGALAAGARTDGLVPIVLTGMALLVGGVLSGRGRWALGAALILGAAFALSHGFWWGWVFSQAQNPVFPLAGSLFPASQQSHVPTQAWFAGIDLGGFRRTPWTALTYLWQISSNFHLLPPGAAASAPASSPSCRWPCCSDPAAGGCSSLRASGSRCCWPSGGSSPT